VVTVDIRHSFIPVFVVEFGGSSLLPYVCLCCCQECTSWRCDGWRNDKSVFTCGLTGTKRGEVCLVLWFMCCL
jgi:hypothetical protein